MKRIAALIAGSIGVAVGVWTGSQTDFFGTATGRSEPGTQESRRQPGPLASDSAAAWSLAGQSPAAEKLFSALRDPIEVRREARIYAAIQSLRADEFPGIMEALPKLPREFRYPLIDTLVEQWTRLDSMAVKAWIRDDAQFSVWACSAWAKVDQQAVLAAAFDPAFAKRAELLLGALAYNLAEKDIPAFWSRLKTDIAPTLRKQVMANLLDRLAATEPEMALALAAEIPDFAGRAKRRAAILASWAEKEPQKAMAKLTEMLPDLEVGVLGNGSVTDVVAATAGKDSTKALEYVATLPGELRSAAGIAAARIKAGKDPTVALDWCLANGVELTRGNRDGFNSWSSSVLGEAISHHPEKTFAWISALPEGAQRDQFMERALEDSLWLTQKAKKFEGESPIVSQLFEQLPPAAQERVASKLGKSWFKDGSVQNVAAWTQKFPEGPIRENAIYGAIQGAYAKDPAMVDRLMESFTAPNCRDAALQGLCNSMDDLRPALAASRALEITSQELRRQTLENAIVPWLKRDPARSQEWLEKEGAGLPGDWKSEWLKSKSKTLGD